MTFHPVIDRELRMASRRKSTYRIRFWTAVIATVTSFGGLVILWANPARMGASNILFTILTSYAFGLCVLAGVFLTADALSEEKREGTLPLLFLADLKGYEVVVGKMMGVALNAFYALLALLPITGLPLLLGGVTGGEFWRTALALANALFVSLAVGVCVSAVAEESRNATSWAITAVAVLAAGLPGMAYIASDRGLAAGWMWFTWVSPFFPFSLALESRYLTQWPKFWATLAASHIAGWCLIGFASWILPKQFQQGVGNIYANGAWQTWRDRLRRHLGLNRVRRKRIGDGNPITWLVHREGNFKTYAWALVIVWAATICGFMYTEHPRFAAQTRGIYYVAKIPAVLFNMLLAIQACRFFSISRQNGLLSVLLSTPLKSAEFVRGQAIGLKRAFFWPGLALIVLCFLPWIVSIAVTLFEGGASRVWPGIGDLVLGLVAMSWFTIGFVADAFAVIWFGMWLGLTAKKPRLAPGMTILFVLIIPSIGACGLDKLADIFFILWGATKLQQDLRWLATQEYLRSSPAYGRTPAPTFASL
jgi:ABC-type transport system involved in multi-copper enzyme maturation permease subunit